MIRRLLLLSVLAVGCVLQASPATADISSGVTLDWTSLSVSTNGLGGSAPIFTWEGSEYGEVDSQSETYPNAPVSDSANANDLISELSVTSTTPKARADALRDEFVLSVYAESQVGMDAGENTNFAYASASNERGFTLTGYGIAIITLDWEMTFSGDPIGSSDLASAMAYMHALYDDGLSDEGGAYASVVKEVDELGEVTGYAGTLSLVVPNLLPGATTTGSFYASADADTSSQNAVPEPASWVLMGLGLGLVGWTTSRRRRK